MALVELNLTGSAVRDRMPCPAATPPGTVPYTCKQTLPAMTGGKVDFALIREATRLELVKLLSSVHGTKVIICLSTRQFYIYLMAWCWFERTVELQRRFTVTTLHSLFFSALEHCFMLLEGKSRCRCKLSFLQSFESRNRICGRHSPFVT